MSRRFCSHRFRQALQAGLPVQRRASAPPTADADVWVFTFDADGQCLSCEDLPSSALPALPGEVFRYTGRELVCETDLPCHRVRSYDPSVGRWLSEEPLQFAADDPNHYRYVVTPPQNQGEERQKGSGV